MKLIYKFTLFLYSLGSFLNFKPSEIQNNELLFTNYCTIIRFDMFEGFSVLSLNKDKYEISKEDLFYIGLQKIYLKDKILLETNLLNCNKSFKTSKEIIHFLVILSFLIKNDNFLIEEILSKKENKNFIDFVKLCKINCCIFRTRWDYSLLEKKRFVFFFKVKQFLINVLEEVYFMMDESFPLVREIKYLDDKDFYNISGEIIEKIVFHIEIEKVLSDKEFNLLKALLA